MPRTRTAPDGRYRHSGGLVEELLFAVAELKRPAPRTPRTRMSRWHATPGGMDLLGGQGLPGDATGEPYSPEECGNM